MSYGKRSFLLDKIVVFFVFAIITNIAHYQMAEEGVAVEMNASPPPGQPGDPPMYGHVPTFGGASPDPAAPGYAPPTQPSGYAMADGPGYAPVPDQPVVAYGQPGYGPGPMPPRSYVQMQYVPGAVISHQVFQFKLFQSHFNYNNNLPFKFSITLS